MKRELILIFFVVFAVVLRLIPHPPNIVPITAIALFSGATFRNRYLGLTIPLVVMALSDLFIGFYSISYWVYGAFILINVFGRLTKNLSVYGTVISTLIFFVVSNFGVWILGYPKTVEGFVTCYVVAIPFLGYSLIGDLFYSQVFKHSFNYIENKWLTTVYSKI